MKKTGIIIAIVAIVAAGGLVFIIRGGTKEGNSRPDTTRPGGKVAKIEYTDNGFSPSTLSVTSPTAITVINRSSKLLQFNSGPHPAHTDNDEYNAGTVSLGQNKTFIVTTKGTFSFHNHLNDSDSGTIIVK